MSRDEKLAANIRRATSTRSRSKSVSSRPARGLNTPGTAAGGKSQGARDKILRYPLDRIDNTTDYLSITVAEFKPARLERLLDNIGTIKQQVKNQANPSDPGTTVTRAGVQNNAEQLGRNILSGVPQISNRLADNGVFNRKNAQYYITLPIPNGITDANSVNWGEDSLNPLQAAGINAINSVAGGQSIPDALTGVASELLKQVGDANVQKAILAGIAGYGVGASPQALISRATGQVLNPNLELLFSGVNLRSFSFAFDFAPRSYAEGQMVLRIISAFKKSIVPKQQSGILIGAPSVFQLQYKQGQHAHPFLNSFKPCALVNMSVNYTGSGTYATYADGTPVHMQLQLQFKELNPIYGEDYDQITSGVGY